ncbi:DgaE family pyridoxal phosphate-dependent ammonia lyase [Vagococcus zengguangii]|uniref:DgaE family pyridoxal phosphate-dependent ammonia lyase n=1 Tax=Vagococcus zengguangii TaxID=2571750 RepID=A0A4D7CSZ6_9ENTE|nr:DgaE family pyridoxal phosphate-dependent ammonia lyase [Vagococcus zengguangii]QCI86114.1 DgaE family pyridoxal phosphate-dependent ammonia lyase [Vagococcus zengguangii]
MNVYDKYKLKQVINASGKMTILGVSKVSDSVLEAQKIGGQNFFEMADLTEKTGRYIAKLLGADNSTVVSSASAGIAQAIAAVIGRGDAYHTMHPYSDRFTRREIIMPKGHNVNYGTSVELMVQQGGGRVVEAGYANECTPEQVVMEITEQTAALLYIKSHHTVQKSMLSIEEMVEIANNHQLPLIVDAAAEEDLTKYYQLGADIVIYSGAKAIEGPSSGLVVGRDPYIIWLQKQSKGLGRSMKIGKDNILALVQAIEDYLEHGSETGESMTLRLAPFISALNAISGVQAEIVQDSAGREIFRAKVKITATHKTAQEVIEELKQGNVAVYTRDYQGNNGIIEFDIRSVDEVEMGLIIEKMTFIMEEE